MIHHGQAQRRRRGAGEASAEAADARLEFARLRRGPRFYVIDANLLVVSATSDVFQDEAGSRGLPPALREMARRLVREQSTPDDTTVGLLGDDRLVRLVPLKGGSEPTYALFVDRHQWRDTMGSAARRFRLTPREAELGAHLMRGLSTCELAAELSISELTVQQHLKNVARKIGVSKRTEIVAALIGSR